MKYGYINGLEKKVSRIIYGTSSLSDQDKEMSFQLLDDIYALGINAFDTAAVYPNGSEAVLFEWISNRGIHDNVVVISKCSHPNEWRNRVHGFDIRSDLTDALAKPGADYMDVYLLHRDDEAVPVKEIIDTLNDLHKEGKIKTFGTSNWSLERIKEANEYALASHLIPFTSNSPHYSLGEQVENPWDGETVSLTGEQGKVAREYYMGNQFPIFAYSSLCRGFFTGKFKWNELEKAQQILDIPSQTGYMHPCNFERLRRVEILAKEKDTTVSNIALSWLFHQPLNVFSIISTGNPKRMEQNIEALKVALTKEELEWLNSIE